MSVLSCDAVGSCACGPCCWRRSFHGLDGLMTRQLGFSSVPQILFPLGISRGLSCVGHDGRLNNIAVEFHLVNVAKGEHREPEFKGRCSFNSHEFQAGAVIWCYHVGEMWNCFVGLKAIRYLRSWLRLSVCCSHQPIRKNPLYCWWVLQAGWKVRRILTLLFHTRAILRFEFCIHLWWLFLGLSLCISLESKELSTMFLKRCLGWKGPPLSILDITLIDFWPVGDSCSKFIYFFMFAAVMLLWSIWPAHAQE
jgi:hypothetical protein